MAPPIRLTLLGTTAAHAADVAIQCASKKAFALFAFLVIERRAHSRRALATLFWGGREPEGARASLRATLFRLPPPLARCLIVDRDSLALSPDAPLSCDVGRFESLVQDGGADSLREAAMLYKGHLLEDFEPDATPEFDDWVSRERTRLKFLAYQVFDRLIDAHHKAFSRAAPAGSMPADEAAVALARQWLQLDPAAERAHRWLMRLHLEAGRREAAKAQLDLCQRALAVAEGRGPSPETLALMASMVVGVERDEPVPLPLPLPVPTPSTSFVGRVEEVAQIAALFDEPTCRMVTLHGLGGVGKTRLAHAVAQQSAGQFADGVTWVPLEGVERPDAVADATARALGIELGPRGTVREALFQRLRSQRRLLVIDNFEHLLGWRRDDVANEGNGGDPVDLLLALLREAPGVRILVTSRETLGVQEEWVYGIEGLAHAHAGSAGSEPVGTAPAVDLFAQRARQAYLGFSLAAEMPHVLRICAQVDGLPLGIELAAAWVRTIPCAEIAHELERGIDVPAAVQRNRPRRQQSLRSVIDFSWCLLTREQQEVLAALSEFRGGFTRDAAAYVAQSTLRELSALVDKALVRRSADSRFSIHPLVRRFAAEKLARSRARRSATRSRHSDHFLRLLCDQRASLFGALHAQAAQQLTGDLDNIRAAWAAKVERGDLRALREGARPLCVILDRLGLYEEWIRTFEEALGCLAAESSADSRSTRCQLLVAAANGHWRRGDVAGARTYGPRLADAILTARDDMELADLHKVRGLIERDAGDTESALRHFLAGADAARRAGEPVAQEQLANEIGVVHWRRGDLAAAREAFAESVRICEAGGIVFDTPTALHNVAYCDLELGRFDSADEAFGRALRIFRERGHGRGEAMVLASLGILARRRGDLQRAQELSRASLALAERAGNAGAVADALDDLAQVMEKLGDHAQAQSLYRRALSMACELGQAHLQCFVLLHLSRSLHAAGDVVESARALREALRSASAHDFQAGRLISILGATALRLAAASQDSVTVACRWGRVALDEAGANVDVKDAIPVGLARVLVDTPQPGPGALRASVVEVAAEVLCFLDSLVGAGK